MESSALASLTPPPAAAGAAATAEGTGRPTLAGAAFAEVLSATDLTVDGLSASAAHLAAPAAAGVPPALPDGKALPPPAEAGRSSPAPGDATIPRADGAATAADLFDALTASPGTAMPRGTPPEANPRGAARRTVDVHEPQAPAEAAVLNPLVLAIRASESQPVRKAGAAPASLVATQDVAGDGVGPTTLEGAAAGRSTDAGPWLPASLEVRPPTDAAVPGAALGAADTVARVPARPDVPHAATPFLAAPLPAAALSSAALGVATAQAGGGDAAPAPRQPAGGDPVGLAASWSAVDDARVAALTRGGAEAPVADQLEIDAPVGGRAWERALGERVVWLVGQQIQAAEIRLNPPHLGPVEVRLTVSGGEASLSFGTPHAPVREAIEQALPRLREQLAEQNLVLVNVDVGDRGLFGQAAGRQEPRDASPFRGAAPAIPDPASSANPGSHGAARGLIDEYA